MDTELSEQARAAQRAYKRQWRAANKDKVAAANRKYWEKLAQKKGVIEENAKTSKAE